MNEGFDPIAQLLAEPTGRGKEHGMTPRKKSVETQEEESSYLLAMPKSMHAELKIRAARKGVTIKELLLSIIKKELAEEIEK